MILAAITAVYYMMFLSQYKANRGEVATLITLGSVAVISLFTLITTVFLKNKTNLEPKAAAPACFRMQAFIEPKAEGGKTVFYVSFHFINDGGNGGKVRLDYNGINVADWTNWTSFPNDFVFDPRYTQPFTHDHDAGIAALPDGDKRMMAFGYTGWVDTCNPNNKYFECTIGISDGNPPYVQGNRCECKPGSNCIKIGGTSPTATPTTGGNKSPTPSKKATATPTIPVVPPEPTNTPTLTETPTPPNTPTPTMHGITPLPTATATPTRTPTPRFRPNDPEEPTVTKKPTATRTPTPTKTPTPTSTPTLSPTPSATPTNSPTPVPAGQNTQPQPPVVSEIKCVQPNTPAGSQPSVYDLGKGYCNPNTPDTIFRCQDDTSFKEETCPAGEICLSDKNECGTPPSLPKASLLKRHLFVLIFNPVNPDNKNESLIAKQNYNDPRTLVKQATEWFKTNGVADYIWDDTNLFEVADFPVNTNGGKWEWSSYLQALLESNSTTPPADYSKITSLVVDQTNNIDLCGKANNGIDEIWIFGAPLFGLSNSIMTGPNGFSLSASPVENTACQKRTPIMGLNYARGLQEIIQYFAYRSQMTLDKVFTGTNEQLWAEFHSSKTKDYTGKGFIGCGEAGYAYNSPQLQYFNTGDEKTNSACNKFSNYPAVLDPKNLTAETLTCENGVYHCSQLTYYQLWWSKMTNYEGPNINDNWIRYIVDPNTVK